MRRWRTQRTKPTSHRLKSGIWAPQNQAIHLAFKRPHFTCFFAKPNILLEPLYSTNPPAEHLKVRKTRSILPRVLQKNTHSAQDLPVVYTAMHGVGRPFVERAFQAFGHRRPQAVAEQGDPDPEFPTVAFPNPEDGNTAPGPLSYGSTPLPPQKKQQRNGKRGGGPLWFPFKPAQKRGCPLKMFQFGYPQEKTY